VPEKWRKDFDIDRLLRVLIFCMEVSAVETSWNCENNNSVENKQHVDQRWSKYTNIIQYQSERCELCEQIRTGLDFAEVACRSFPCQCHILTGFHRNSTGHVAIYACAGQSRDFLFDRGLARHLHQGLNAMSPACDQSNQERHFQCRKNWKKRCIHDA